MILSRENGALTTTSYAILGLLAIKPWTTYELAQQMDRSLGRLWPRAESKIYEEPKKLVALGLARASTGSVGRRPRTVYAITAAGRRALKAWLAKPGAPIALESEQLLKVFFAEHGTKRDVVATLDAMRAWAEEQRLVHIAVAQSYVAGEGSFPERMATLALTGRFLFEFTEMVGAWAERSLAAVERWPDDPARAEVDWRPVEEVARLGDGAAAAPTRPLRKRTQ
jgi:DNA-binding PadR family transcriptional regulator